MLHLSTTAAILRDDPSANSLLLYVVYLPYTASDCGILLANNLLGKL